MTAMPNGLDDIALMRNSLRINSAFSSWPLDAMNQLLSFSRIRRHKAGSNFSADLSDEAEIFLIISGEALVTLASREDEESVLTILGSGAFMGFFRIFSAASQVALAFRAHSDVAVIHMPTSLIIEILDREPALWKDMVLMMTRQHASHVHTLSSQIAGSLRQRVAATVERLVTLYGTSSRAESSIRLQMSQADLAQILQASRQAVHRELKAIAASGAIELEYKAIAVRDMDVLRSYAVGG